MMMMMFHKPVMLKEAIDSLEIKGSGVYVDLTFGGGGHSKEILQRINDDGRLIAFDQDESATKNKIDDSRVVLLKQNFIYLEQNLKYLKISKVDGILADLGVSSFQIGSIDRGFSFERDSNLDMRMNQKSSRDAIEILNNYSESDLANIFFNYSYIESKYLESNEVGITGKEVEFVPKNNFKTGLKFGYKDYAINFQYSYLSSQFTDSSNAILGNLSVVIGQIPSYEISDLSMSYKLRNIKFEAGVKADLSPNCDFLTNSALEMSSL